MNTDTLILEINRLKAEKDALILAHYYQLPEVQDIADFVGDSLALAKKGKESDKNLIVVCGVQFMAESAKILSPEKTILLPAKEAGCPMADMITAKQLSDYKEKHPEKTIVSYVNTSADVKALTDICVTSSNALSIVEKLDSDDLYFLPDKNLAKYINAQLGDKKMDHWLGFCATHERLKANDVLSMKKRYKDAKVLVHPECNPEVVALADFVGSTSQIIRYANESPDRQFIIGTEEGVLHKMRMDNPEKEFILASKTLVCKNMKRTTLQHVYNALKNEETRIELDENTLLKATQSLEKMLALS